MDDKEYRRLNDAAWAQLQPAIASVRPRRGRRPLCDRRFVDAVRWMLRTGSPWRDLPKEFGPWQSCYGRFLRWAKAGTWARLYEAFGGGKQGQVAAHQVCSIDRTSIRVHQHGAPSKEQTVRQQVGVSRGERTSKLHVACHAGANGSLQASKAALSPGNRRDLLAAVPLSKQLPAGSVLVADKAYDAHWLRSRLRRQQTVSVVPSRGQQSFGSKGSSSIYRRRNEVERLFGRIKQFRRVASRYERQAVHFGGFVLVALFLSCIAAAALPRG